MKQGILLKVTGLVLAIIIGGFVVASILDIIIAVLRSRFYSEAAFVVTFAVAGIFAACIAYINISEMPAYKSSATHYTILGLLMGCGLLFFLLLARLEGGEYEVAFKGYGAALFFTSFLFFRWNKEQKKKAP